MKEYNLKTEPLTFISIGRLEISRQVNEHGTARIEGYIVDEDEEVYLKQLVGKVWEKVDAEGRDGETKTLFCGLVTGFSIDRTNGQKRMTLELTTGTCLMDMKPHFRTFQNGAMTYEEIFRQITETYENSGLIKNRPLTEATGGLIVQYKETDWEFLKRMAGKHHSFLVPGDTTSGVKYFFDLPKRECFEWRENDPYTVRRAMGDFLRKRAGGLSELRETASQEYIIESREEHRIGDQIRIQGRPLFVFQIESRYQSGEMLHICHLKPREGLDTLETFCDAIAGCSIMAEVLEVREDKVRIRALEDENREQDIRLWYPYATVYSSPDGTGWYCMPEIGDRVRLCVPSRQEDDAYVAGAVHLETESRDRKHPENKSMKNKYQKEIRFTPDSIVLTNNQGTKISLSDREGIEIVSSHSIDIRAKNELTISSEDGSLTAAGSSAVSLRQRTTGIEIEKGISFTGGELRVQ